ncbi:ABC transporter substrate-binding protein [Saccharomonospora glauca]|uniref:ABC-type branched-chain amino acid transport system, periplasmic component n=1 Tax=Saccharomonospora glauca K62 TaxID=928724 RepID=I1D5D1_9PSEU|nr:ABC transporter substrate-binding protein [Saccharomonospora glauca]EIF00156.1 ABC-type branched-chain amino acid transport system, periplasmic component [Saccharomonospora glauca K62]
MRASAAWRTAVLASAAALVVAGCGGAAERRDVDAGGDGVLNLGYVLPETGPLSYLGPAQIASVKLAVEEINEAGGVLGLPVPEVVASDEAGRADAAARSADRVLSTGADAIVGAASSEASSAIVDSVTGSGVVQCSGSNTAATFGDYSDNGLYFRTAPSDDLQAMVLGKVIAEDGNERVALVARGDDYGRGLLELTTKALEAAGVTVVLGETYETGTTNFDGIARKVAEANPDAVVVVSFEEGTRLLRALIEAGVGPRDLAVYGADGLRRTELASAVSPDDPGALAGMKGTAPTLGDEEYGKQLTAFAPEVKDLQYAAQVFDCVTIIALAVEAAQSDDPTVFAPEMVRVTTNGEKCTSFAACKDLLDRGVDIDYEGVSGPLDFEERGEPREALFDVYAYDESGALRTVRTEKSAAPN